MNKETSQSFPKVQTLQPIEFIFTVQPILGEYLNPENRQVNPDAKRAAIVESMLLNTDNVEAQNAFRFQLRWDTIACIISSASDPKVLQQMESVANTYNLREYDDDVPVFWREYMCNHWKDNPTAPHLKK